jgi:D-alanine-D-alanine ligase
MDKAVTHTILDRNDIPTAEWDVISINEINHLEKRCNAIIEKLGLPLFVKPANCGSSIGINKAVDLQSLKDAVKIAFAHDSKVVIEEFISGKELEVAVFGYESPFASSVGEIEPCNDFYDYDAKYILNSTNLYIPARISEKDSVRIRETAVKAFKAMGCTGLSRVDFFLTDDGDIILNEINTLPGFTPISMYPKLMEDIGISSTELVQRLIKQAMEHSSAD